MPTPTKGPRLGGGPAHERLILANLATSLFEHERIMTTQAKAKRLRPFAERLITFAKRGDLHARRHVMAVVRDKDVVHKLFADIGPRYAERPGGYTRVIKTGPRKGDNAPMAQISLVEPLTIAQEAVGEAERARRGRRAQEKAPTARTREAADELKEESTTADSVARNAATAEGEAVVLTDEEPNAGDSAAKSQVPSADVDLDDQSNDAAQGLDKSDEPTASGSQASDSVNVADSDEDDIQGEGGSAKGTDR